ncbi:echinoderm microtubule-associated protein-like 2 isoform X5 [Cephus cinctus]|uniref:Echinoderm microtubule-associated protein-like 2 isoform X5 n=1 Tax=Cephus cinctus TaxID=211228 RepID=A0AAJ7RAA0_CEPCN|nr:echinoderm microtubule-associated protein-like 2 isoform X5 [Cephus cinctus]XP_024937137.1 echinoderm microtubule-associated protein-like 2 isoform X5 [Cephus cinctus]XP_024937138.1 echinoderm microtubule-associated protein-like 2 isoform X5 [Cephus cinctus]
MSTPDTMDTINEAEQAWHEMLECETGSLLGRVADLERQSLAQRDEIVCLRATLADALRRISQLEGRDRREDERIDRRGDRAISSPIRNGHVPLRSSQSTGSQKDLRLRQGGTSSLKNNSGSTHDVRDGSSPKRPTSYTPPSQLPQRRSVHYQSTGSLHSDSPSSSSVSPVPSPSPRATPLPVARSPTTRANGPPQSSLRRAKRWSSTGDFIHSHQQSQGNHAQLVGSSRLSASTKSLFNLFKPPVLSNVKHGTRDMQYNEEEGTVLMYLRGRPVVLYVPTPAIESYDLHKVSTPPQSKLKLDWVYGYRGRDCRSNLHLLPTGEIVYFVAAAVVLYNMEEHSQRHYLGHTDDVKCIAIHPNKLLVATGQVAGTDRRDSMPHIRIWNSVSLSTMSVIGSGEFDGSICCLSFSKADGGNFLCAIDETSDHNISVWDWQKSDRGVKVTETKCSVDTVVCAEWHPLERNQIVSCGKGHVSFWSLNNGGTLYKRMGVFENRDKPRYVTCVAFNQNGDILTGDSNGNIIVWARGTNTISRLVRNLHEGSIFSICVLKNGNVVTGGGKDGRILHFDGNLNPTGEEAQIEDHFGGIRTVSEGRGSQLLVGTTRNCILVGDVEMGFSPAMLGHTEEVWGLAAHPTLPQFATAAHDRLLQMWDSLSHTVVWSKDIGEQAQSVCFSPDGTVMVVGCVSGKWLAIDSETRELYTHHSDGSEPLQVVRFSPDGSLLAVGSRDNYIYIYQVNEDATKYSRVGRCMPKRIRRHGGHSSFITHLDWSVDSQYLRSNSGDYELLYWNPGVCRQIPQSSMLRDVDWATHTCVISFETIGIWPEGADGTDVNNCTRSGDGKLLATGDDFGKVKLFSYPACQPKMSAAGLKLSMRKRILEKSKKAKPSRSPVRLPETQRQSRYQKIHKTNLIKTCKTESDTQVSLSFPVTEKIP